MAEAEMAKQTVGMQEVGHSTQAPADFHCNNLSEPVLPSTLLVS